MNDKDDALARAWHWLKDLGHRGHAFGCLGAETLPEHIRRPCNCGRDALLDAISHAASVPPTTGTNGRELL